MPRYRSLLLALTVCLLIGTPTADAQSNKTSKEAEKLVQAGATARQEIRVAFDQLNLMLEQYNAIMDGSADRNSAYKALVGEVKSADKLIKSARKSADALNQQSARLFAVWQADIDGMSDADLKARHQGRLESRRERYAAFTGAIAVAREELSPFVKGLRDQIAFLGQDLTDDAILDLQDEAKELNEVAATLVQNIREQLGIADATPPEAEPQGATEAEQDAEGEEEDAAETAAGADEAD